MTEDNRSTREIARAALGPTAGLVIGHERAGDREVRARAYRPGEPAFWIKVCHEDRAIAERLLRAALREAEVIARPEVPG